MLDLLITHATLPDGRSNMSVAVQNGKIVEVWGLSDGVQLLTQLGQTQLPKMPPQAKKTGQGYVQPHN